MTNDEAAYFNPLLLDFRYPVPQPDEERVLSVVRGDNGHINAFSNKCIHGVEGVVFDRKTGRQISPDCKMCTIG